MPRERREFVRRSGFRDASLVVIACEGAETEPDYFNDVKDRLHTPGLHVEVLQRDDRENSSPERVRRMLDDFAARWHLREEDTLWLLVDRDPQSWKPAMISEVAAACFQKGYRFTLSNPCFEVWLLLPFEDVPVQSEDRRSELFSNVDQLLKREVGAHRHDNPDTFDVLGPAVGTAVQRAIALDVNPDHRWPEGLGTRVHLLVEHLLDLFRRRSGVS